MASLGIRNADGLPVQMLEELRPDMLGAWLPYALSSLYALLAGMVCKSPPKQAEILKAWGLQRMAENMEENETESTLAEAFGVLK